MFLIGQMMSFKATNPDSLIKRPTFLKSTLHQVVKKTILKLYLCHQSFFENSQKHIHMQYIVEVKDPHSQIKQLLYGHLLPISQTIQIR